LFQQRHKQQQKTLPTNPGTKKEGMPLTRHDKNKKKQKFFPSEEEKKLQNMAWLNSSSSYTAYIHSI